VTEGVFDAVIMEQALAEAGITGIAVVATVSTNGSYEDRYVMLLSLCESVVVAFDNDEGGNKAAGWWLKRLPDSRRWAPTGGDINEMLLKDKAALIEAAMCGFHPLGSVGVMEAPAIIEEQSMDARFYDELSTECCLCGKEMECYDEWGCAWCTEHMPGLSESTNNMSEDCQNTGDNITTEITIPVKQPAKPLKKRREPPKPVNGCSADGCYGRAGKDGRDVLGGLWCPNCVLRRDLVNGMHAAGFPRLEYSPSHFIESGEDASKSFAKAMSPMAVAMAVREINRLSCPA